MFAFFFFNDTATTEIYTLSLHDALPISPTGLRPLAPEASASTSSTTSATEGNGECKPRYNLKSTRSEEHTSELQSRLHLVCRLLLEKKKLRTERCARARTTPCCTLERLQ